jgi:hypothetical protein
MSDLNAPNTSKTNPLAGYFRQPKMYLKLPSGGQFYPEGSLDRSQIDEYPVYAMTAIDELMFKTPDALMNGQATVEVIRSCIPAIKDPWKMPSIDLDVVLVAIRIATYGESMEMTSTCPSCREFNEYNYNLLGYLDKASTFSYESRVDLTPLIVNIRPYSYKEVTKMAIKTFEQQKIIEIVNDETLSEQEKVDQFGESFVKLTQMTVDIVAGCVESIETPDGTVTDAAMILEFIENSSSETFNAINTRVTKMKDEIALRSETVECQHCQFKFEIDITMDQANFFAVGS